MAKVVHFEIPFDDKARAMKFYADIFGWQLMDVPQIDYVMAQTVEVDDKQMPKEPGAINGGMMKRPREAPSPLIYMDVPSVQETLEKVKAAGGALVTPFTPVPGVGGYARVRDTEGNVIGLFQSGQ